MKKNFFISLVVLFSFFTLAYNLRAQGSWSPRASLPDSARCAGIGFSIDSMGYVGLGSNFIFYPEKYFNSFWQYNPNNNTWNKKADFPGRARICPATFVIGHDAFVVTGANNDYYDTCYKECWEYNAQINTWTRKADFPGVARAGAVGFAVGSKGYVGTGQDAFGNVYADFWEYDTATNIWTQKANFGGTARQHANGFGISGKGYVCFGWDGSLNPLGDMWVYDTGTNAWTQKTLFSGPSRHDACGFVIGTNIYVGLGASNNECFKDFWQYNVLTDTWVQMANFPSHARLDCLGFSIANHGYIGLGNDSNAYLFNDWYEYTPDSLTGFNEVLLNEPSIRIYPNPFEESCNIILPQNASSSCSPVFALYNIMGEMVETNVVKTGRLTYNLKRGRLPAGMYILSVGFNHQFIYKKLIINN